MTGTAGYREHLSSERFLCPNLRWFQSALCCITVYKYKFIHTHTVLCGCMRIYICIPPASRQLHTHTTHGLTRTHQHAHTHAHKHTFTRKHTHVHTPPRGMYVCRGSRCIYIQAYINRRGLIQLLNFYIRVHVCKITKLLHTCT